MLKHLWLAGAKRVLRQLHLQVAAGWDDLVVDLMDLHLIWDNDGRVFLKSILRLLLDPVFWQKKIKCPYGCMCLGLSAASDRGNRFHPAASCRDDLWKVALGFLYTYACLIPWKSTSSLQTKGVSCLQKLRTQRLSGQNGKTWLGSSFMVTSQKTSTLASSALRFTSPGSTPSTAPLISPLTDCISVAAITTAASIAITLRRWLLQPWSTL